MKRILSYGFLAVFIWASGIDAKAQDTLYYKNGTIKPVKILQIDSVNMKLVYRQVEQVSFVLIDALQKFSINSEVEVVEQKAIAIQPKVEKYSPYKRPVRYGFFEKPFEEPYGRLMMGLNVTSIFSGAFEDDIYPNNFSPEFVFEYLITPDIGLNITYRQGIDVITDSDIQNWDFRPFGEGNDLIRQVSFFPRYYIYGQKAKALYTGPVINYGESTFIKESFYTYWDIDPQTNRREIWRDTDSEFEVENQRYIEVGWGGGILFNFSPELIFSTQFILVRTNSKNDEFYSYSNFLSEDADDIYLESTSIYNERRLRGYFQVHLMYRFGKNF